MDEFDLLEDVARRQATKYYGKYRGFVTDVKDPDNRGRVKVTVPSILGEGESQWAEPCFPYVGWADAALIAVPPVGAAIFVEFIEGDASARCGISMKGIDIVVGGNVGHMSAFMGQAGSLVVCGDAGADLGDSVYEARLYVRGSVASLGADCKEKEMTPHHLAKLTRLLAAANMDADPSEFRRFGSARKLYNFNIDNLGAY